MIQINQYLLVGIVCVLLIASLGAIAAKKLSFNFKNLRILSLLVYVSIGYFSGLNTGPVVTGLVCTLVGLVDSTIGWKISWLIGPGKLPDERNTKSQIIKTIIMVSLLAGVTGFCVANLALLTHGAF
jgi:hypothetical protein